MVKKRRAVKAANYGSPMKCFDVTTSATDKVMKGIDAKSFEDAARQVAGWSEHSKKGTIITVADRKGNTRSYEVIRKGAVRDVTGDTHEERQAMGASVSAKRKAVIKASESQRFVAKQRTALDGKTWWCVFDTKENKWSTKMNHGKYKTKKECEYAISNGIESAEEHQAMGASTSVKRRVTVKAARGPKIEDWGDGPVKVFWKSGKWSIIMDGYGLGITDGWGVERPIIYTHKNPPTVAYDGTAVSVPPFVKRKFEELVQKGVLKNRSDLYDSGEWDTYFNASSVLKSRSRVTAAKRNFTVKASASARRRAVKAASGERHWLSTELPRDMAWNFKVWLRENGIKFEPSEADKLIHFEVYVNEDEAKRANDFIDSIDNGVSASAAPKRRFSVKAACGGKKSIKAVYRQYEDPYKLEQMLEEAQALLAEDPDDEFLHERVHELKERINFAWQDDEYDAEYADRFDDDVFGKSAVKCTEKTDTFAVYNHGNFVSSGGWDAVRGGLYDIVSVDESALKACIDYCNSFGDPIIEEGASANEVADTTTEVIAAEYSDAWDAEDFAVYIGDRNNGANIEIFDKALAAVNSSYTPVADDMANKREDYSGEYVIVHNGDVIITTDGSSIAGRAGGYEEIYDIIKDDPAAVSEIVDYLNQFDYYFDEVIGEDKKDDPSEVADALAGFIESEYYEGQSDPGYFGSYVTWNGNVLEWFDAADIADDVTSAKDVKCANSLNMDAFKNMPTETVLRAFSASGEDVSTDRINHGNADELRSAVDKLFAYPDVDTIVVYTVFGYGQYEREEFCSIIHRDNYFETYGEVSASSGIKGGYDLGADTADDTYTVDSFFGYNGDPFRGLADGITTDDWSEVESWSHEHLLKGENVKIDGPQGVLEITADEYNQAWEDGAADFDINEEIVDYKRRIVESSTAIKCSDDEVERLWESFADVPMNPETEEIEEDFMEFPAGTKREDVWHWFDKNHSKGIAHLLYGKEDIKCAYRDDAVDKEAVRELVLVITNDGDLYRQRTTPMIENLKKKVAKGKYDRELAVKLWQYLADEGVRRYDKEYGSGRGSVSMLNPATRRAIAEELRDYYEEQIMWDFNHADDAKASTEITTL